jgi:hypothetical protein
VVALSRAFALLLAGLAVAACSSKPGPEDPAVAVGTGIPMGAMSADGVSFGSPLAHANAAPPHGGGTKIEEPPLPLPLDPFDPAPTPPSPPPPTKLPRKKGTAL